MKKAIEYLTFLKVEMDKFPKFLAEYLNQNFFPEYRKFLHFLEKDHIGKLDQDNNKLKNFNKITMSRYEKKTYRTFRGLWSTLMHKKDVWIENRKRSIQLDSPHASNDLYILSNKYYNWIIFSLGC